MHHFLPEYIKQILHKIFDTDEDNGGKYGDVNKIFMANKLDKRIGQMRLKLNDKWSIASREQSYVK